MTDPIIVNDYYDSETGTFSYLVIDKETKECIVIDPVLGYDMVSSYTSLEPTDPIINDIESLGLRLVWILETHAHADHLTSAYQLKQQYSAAVAIGQGITRIQNNFKSIYRFGDSYDTTGSAFDRLLRDGECLTFGNSQIEVIATPGHTSDSLTYKIGRYLFVGDTLFHPVLGSARCDFPGGDAHVLFDSIQRLLAHDDDCLICLCHDYPEEGRQPETYITVATMREMNIHLLQADYNRDAFKTLRDKRDASLDLPKLIIPSIQVNTQAGLDLSKTDASLTWPINRF